MGTEPRQAGKGQGAALASGAGPGPAPLDPSGSLATQQVDQMVAAWRRGERPLAEEILADHPELGDEAAIRLIYEEVCLRLEAGQTVDPAEIVRRFPHWRSELEILLDCELKMHAGPGPLAFPEIGETVAGFRLIWELGRGAAGRVFLASQPSLADRPVVLKITSRGREEHLSLARLQHMNIVPLYSEHVLQARNLQILCMPFLGGATLAQVFDLLKDQPPEARTGKQLMEAVDEIERRLPIASPAQGPFRNFLGRSSYVSAICSIGACLADGLQYAHERKLVHMDIKPSNVLLAGDGQPMLLDFHLARGPIRPQEPAPAWLGGTPGSMAPEQERAVNCLRDGRPITERVDERADLYALGLLLYEALGGPRRESPGAVLPPLHRINGGVSPGLSDVIHKCLCQDPRDRYADAAALATDLRCHLADLPLRGVPNRSLAERWRKWRRRRPFGLLRSLLLLVSIAAVVVTAALAGVGYRHRVTEIQSSLDQGRALLKRGQHSEAAIALRRGLALTGDLPFVAEQKASPGPHPRRRNATREGRRAPSACGADPLSLRDRPAPTRGGELAHHQGTRDLAGPRPAEPPAR